MLYRAFGKTGVDVSILGFGTMRLPLERDSNGDPRLIDEAEAIRIIRHGIDSGINYIDTAYPYHGRRSEIVTGMALKDGYRERVLLATKLPTWLVKERPDCDAFLAEQLEKLDVRHLDVYLVHALNSERWENMKRIDIGDFLNKAKADGRIKFAGFSFHDTPELFKEILDSYNWDMCQLQYNYMEAPAWTEAVQYAHKKGVAVVVMEPLLGGKLANNLPDKALAVFEEAAPGRTAASWAFQWLYNKPQISVVLSGMSNMSQVTENLRIASHHGYANALTEAEMDAYGKVKKTIDEMTKVKCTACEYCMPCPSGVNIPEVFNVYNLCGVFTDEKEAQHNYKYHVKAAGGGAERCIQCGLCEPKCPQKIQIVRDLEAAKKLLETPDMKVSTGEAK